MPVYNPISSSTVDASGIIGTLSVVQGGSGQSNASSARTAFGLGSLATQNSIALATDTTGTLSVVKGGTNAANLADFFTNFSIAPSTYTPTLTDVANLTSSTAYIAQYLRVGNTVAVSGTVDVDPILTATTTQLGISLPVASSITARNQVAGSAFSPVISGMGTAILGDETNDRAQMEWVASDITSQPIYYIFNYQIL